MFKASEIEALSMSMDEVMHQLEDRIMSDIIRRIKINGEITRSADWQIHRLNQLGMGKLEIKKAISEALKFSDDEMHELYKKIVKSGYEHDKSVYMKSGVERIPFEDNFGLQQFISAVAAQTQESMTNITASLGFAKRENGKLIFTDTATYYQKTLDSAMMDISSGAFDYNTVLKRVVNELTNSGLRTVDYASGRSIRVESAARMAVMTGMSQLTAKVNDDNARELGTDKFEVTYHGGARPSHQEWQGRVYSRAELESVCGLGTVTGLCGAHCYHDFYPFIEGISERTYTDEELDHMNAEENKPKEFGGKKYTAYEAQQHQRDLERTMRAQRQKIKLLEEGGANEEDIINARARYRATSAEYTRFSKAMNIPQQRDRVTVDGLGNIGVGKWKADLTLKDYDDIIYMKGKMSDVDVRKWYIAHNNRIPEMIDTTKTIEEQARQACALRNKNKFHARELMKDQQKRQQLDISDPIESFENIIQRKMEDKHLSYEEALKDVIKTSKKTRKSVNKILGVEE